MAITFQCPACQVTHTASDSVAGRRIRCPKCDTLVDVPKSASLAKEMVTAQPADTVPLSPGENTGEKTVVLEVVEVEPPMIVPGLDVPAPSRSHAKAPRVEPSDDSAATFQMQRRREDSEMDMTPMVDVVFQLLIFFMLTAAFALQKSLAVPKSPSDQPSESVVAKPIDESPEYVIVRVDEFNTYHVLSVDWEQEAPSVQDLHIQLRRARDGSASGVIPTKLRVEAHGDALHGRVVAALDTGTATGFEEVQLISTEEEK